MNNNNKDLQNDKKDHQYHARVAVDLRDICGYKILHSCLSVFFFSKTSQSLSLVSEDPSHSLL